MPAPQPNVTLTSYENMEEMCELNDWLLLRRFKVDTEVDCHSVHQWKKADEIGIKIRDKSEVTILGVTFDQIKKIHKHSQTIIGKMRMIVTK